MAAKKFFVNNGVSNIGPFEMAVIIDKVNKAELKATDQLCVNVDNDEWMLICQHAEFVEHFKTAKPKPRLIETATLEEVRESTITHGGTTQGGINTSVTSPSIRHTELPEQNVMPVGTDLTAQQWYVLKGKNRFGPFVYLDVVRMLQEKSVFEFDYIWCQGLDTWKRVAEVACFTPEYIRGLYGTETKGGDSKIFYRRNFPRTKYECPLIVHDNTAIWKGKTVEVGEGGAGIIIENAMILPGQNVYLHFKPGPLSKSFNALCEVVSKRYTKGLKNKEAPVLYGIKFINITKQDREAIKQIYSSAA